MKQIIRRIAALVIGLGLGATALAGLESVTHISDLNSAWPLGSDLASTSDDHIRNIKVALKTDFPNVNAAVTPTPTQFNQLTTDTFTNLAVTSSTIPVNGIYLPAANTLGFASNTTKWGSVNSTGNWTINAPTSGPMLNIGSAAQLSWYAQGSSGSALQLQSSGIWAFDNGAGNIQSEFVTNLYQSSLGTYNYAKNGVALRYGQSIGGGHAFQYAASGTAGAAATLSTAFAIGVTGNLQGLGPVAATLVDMTPDTGTFTLTLVGGTTSPTPTVKFSRVGRLVILVLPNTSFTSNSTGFSATGVPASLRPATSIAAIAPIGVMQDNSAEAANCLAGINSSGTITFYKASAVAANWTSVGNKGIGSPSNVTAGNFMVYSLD